MTRKLRVFRRDTIRELKWLDFDNHIFDETWHRYYTLFGFIKFDLTYKDHNNLSAANALKSRPIGGFKSSK